MLLQAMSLPPILVLAPNVSGHAIRSRTHIRFTSPHKNGEQGKTAFIYYALHKWEEIQDSLKLVQLVSLEAFKARIEDMLHSDCTCFL